MEEFDEKLTEVFNSLSKGGQRQLKVAAVTNTIVDDAWADSVKHPWKFPLYALYIAGMVLPTPGTHTLVMAGLLIGWAKIGLTREARRLSTEIAAAQQPPALMKEFAACVGTDKQGAPAVKTGALIGNVLSNTWHGFKDARRQIFGGGPSGQGHNPT
ncbi:MAG TPA: hypothetical protein VL625_00520 [Patescibacteria group bacterium]|nr:hypothetical protein [Patescibacteria group bacterium]